MNRRRFLLHLLWLLPFCLSMSNAVSDCKECAEIYWQHSTWALPIIIAVVFAAYFAIDKRDNR